MDWEQQQILLTTTNCLILPVVGTYNVSSHLEGGHPSNLIPWAIVAPSIQQPYLVSSHVLYSGQSLWKGPTAALKPSGQQPNVVLEQGTTGSGLHLLSNIACNSSLVHSEKKMHFDDLWLLYVTKSPG